LPYVETNVFTISIPVTSISNDISEMWYLPPYNPFIFANERSTEIHLSNYPPTELADISLFNTEDDASDLSVGIYYKTANHLPWAFHIAESSGYPIERIEVIQAFPDFGEWAESDGVLSTDWYANPNNNFVYPE